MKILEFLCSAFTEILFGNPHNITRNQLYRYYSIGLGLFF